MAPPINDQWKKGRARLNRTTSALLARGVDLDLADTLQRRGETLASLQQKSRTDLEGIGISSLAVDNILAGARPPIPFVDLAGVLIANRFTCCVCRDGGRSVVVHHIKPWARSRSHAPENLAVLCLQDHDRAHKTGGLTQNLTPALVKEFKLKWERKVSLMDARAVLRASAIDSDSWWLFNHVRLLEVARTLQVDLSKIPGLRHLQRYGIIPQAGTPRARDRNKLSYIYEGQEGVALYAYTREMLNAVLTQLTAVNVSDDLDRSYLSAVISPGDFLIVQGSHTFKSTAPDKDGPGQSLIGSRKANGVDIYFAADRWEATSNSARSMWLSGRQDAVSLLRVMSIDNSGDALRIGTTAIAVGAALQGVKTREYANAPFRSGYQLSGWEEDDSDNDDLDWELSSDNPTNYSG